MRLTEALEQIADASGLDAATLIAYAAEDPITGRDTGEFDAMSVFTDEGRVLYALVRAVRPAHVLEIGTAAGCTAAHILSALEANGGGVLTSVDIDASAGWQIPAYLLDRWTFVNADALTYDIPEDVDFIFEDGAHTYAFNIPMFERIKAHGASVLVTHDYNMPEDQGFAVARAMTEVFGDAHGHVQIDSAFPGLGYVFNLDTPVVTTTPQTNATRAPRSSKRGGKRG